MLIPLDKLQRKYNIKADGVLHVGAHWGEEAEAYEEAGIKKVIWIEADPKTFAGLENRIRNKYPNHICINAMVTDKDHHTHRLNRANNQGQSSSILEFGTHTKAHPEVKFFDSIELRSMRIDSLMNAYSHIVKIDSDNWFLNIDIQGAELLALKGMGDLLKHFKYAYIEVNEAELYKGCPLVAEIDEYLDPFGFRRVETEMTNFKWGDAFYLKS